MRRVCVYWLAVATLSAGCASGRIHSGYETALAPRCRNAGLAQRLNRQGLTHIKNNDYDAAEAAFREALEADLFYPAAHNNLGLVLIRQGRAYDAAWQFEFAAKLAPHSAEPRHNLDCFVETPFSAKSPCLAIAPRMLFEAILGSYERINLGVVMERTARLADAEQYYCRALEIDPDNIEVMGHLARVYIKTNKRDGRLRDLLRELAFRAEEKDWNAWARQWLIRLSE